MAWAGGWLLLVTARGWAQPELAWRGHVVDPLTCEADPAQSYALYLPSNYSAERTWPVVFCFDPIARGRVPLDRFRGAAEKHGYILIGSNNSQNGDWTPVYNAANAILIDAQRRFSIDTHRLYAAGFSGGARAACAVAEDGKFAGVVACGGGFPSGTTPAQVPFAFFAAAGRGDFNLSEMFSLQPELEQRKTPHRLVLFEGGHDWAPEPVAEEALAWFDLLAMRAGTLPRDQGWILTEYRRRLEAAGGMAAADEKDDAYHSIAADFDQLVDRAELTNRINALEQSREYRRAIAARQRSLREETRWVKEINDALRNGGDDTELELGGGFLDTSNRAMPAAGSGDARSAGPMVDSGSSFVRVPTVSIRRNRSDPFEKLRYVSTDIRRYAKKDPAAVRALNSAFVQCMTDGARLFDARQFQAAANAFEAATVIEPDAGWSYFQWARARTALGDKTGARELLQTATAKGYREQGDIDALQAQLDPKPALPAAALPNVPFGVTPLRPAGAPAPAGPLLRPRINSTLSEPTFIVPSSMLPTTSAPAEGGEPGVLVLSPVRVKAQAFSSFGLGLKVMVAPRTHQIAKIVIYQVDPDSDAMANGLHPDDEIVRIEGRSVNSYVGSFSRDSDFGRLFVDRKPGDRITLEIVTSAGERRQVTLTEGGDPRPPWLRFH